MARLRAQLVIVLLTSNQAAWATGKADLHRTDAPTPIAVPPEPPADGSEDDEHPFREPDGDATDVDDGAGPRFSFGRAFHQELADGWYGRIETEYFEQQAHGYRRRHGSLWGMRLGLEGWGSSEDWGAGLPMSVYGGYRQPMFGRIRGLDLFGALGAGIDVVSFDRVDEKSGMGVFTPRAEAVLGFDLGGVRLLTDGGVQYRWHFSQGDFAQWRAGVSIGLHAELWDG